MKCKCGLYKHMGFPCWHIACVLSEPTLFGIGLIEDMKGFLSESVHVFWWKLFLSFGIGQGSKHKEIKQVFKDLYGQDEQAKVGLQYSSVALSEVDVCFDQFFLGCCIEYATSKHVLKSILTKTFWNK